MKSLERAGLGSLRIGETTRDACEVSASSSGESKYGLSPRELSVLYLLAEGYTDKQVAQALRIAAYTVNCHVGAILTKMDVRSRTAAAVTSIREHMFDHGPPPGALLHLANPEPDAGCSTRCLPRPRLNPGSEAAT